MTRKLFGASSEQTKDSSGKDGSTEKSAESDPGIASGENRARKSSRKTKPARAELYESLPVRTIKCDMPEADRFCPDCNAPMEHLGYDFAHEELRVISAKVYRVQYMQEKLVCPVCRQEDETAITAAKTPTPLVCTQPCFPGCGCDDHV